MLLTIGLKELGDMLSKLCNGKVFLNFDRSETLKKIATHDLFN